MKAAENFEKLAKAYEKAYFQFAQRNSQNFETVVTKYLQNEKEMALKFGCSQECVEKCMANIDMYAMCT